MTDTNEMIERLRRRGRLFPASGGGTITAEGMVTSYVTDDGFRYINPDGPEAADALDAKDRTIAGLREAFLETREFLSLLEPAVCDWSCPSKWRSGEPQPHSKLHHDLRDVLHKHETVAIALRDQRLARRMGAEFVPHDYDATPLKGQTP